MVKNEIRVFARLKPEARRKNTANYQIHRRPQKHLEEDYLVLNGPQKSANEYINNRPESWNFAFHKIFDSDIKQDEVFENVAQPVVQSVLNGYNATIFAYGQTGSGKTFSITGDPERYEDRGVLPRTVQYLFETIQKNPDNLYSVEIAYLEIYNENGYDLLDPKHEVVTKLEDLPRVTIQEDEAGTLHLKNLSFRSVENEKDALALLFLGDTNRAISETPMNPQSSRSHCIFTIAVSVKQSGSQHLTRAKMHLVDLAGSERVYKCCISGTILTEAKHINLSLHYLEQVIVCLGQQNVSHIPYRNSLLTAILRDSLGGNCLTTMLATLSLNTSNFEETISTCRFSQRVALIKNDVDLVLERNPEDENRFLKMEIERLRNQIAQLTRQPVISGELTANEKQDLDSEVSKFLEQSDATINWVNDERKMKYCLQVLRESFNGRNREIRCVEESAKDLNYYRNLVVQRDKEISTLISMLKKTGRNNSSNTSAADPGPLKALENHNETSPRISIIAKKVRLRDLMAEARSIAELIKNGKASIGDLKTRMTNIKPVEIQALNKTLQVEQSRLAHNLSLLKTLKSEANYLKSALIEESEHPENSDTILTHRNVNSSTPRIETDSKNGNIDAVECRRRYFTPNRIPASPKPEEKREDGETDRNVQPKKPLNIFSTMANEMKGFSERTDPELDDCDVLRTSSTKVSNNNSDKVSNLGNKLIDVDVESNGSSSRVSKTATFLNMDSKKLRNDSDTRRRSAGERFLVAETSPSGESRRSSFRGPAFLRDTLWSHGDYGAGCKEESLLSEKSCEPNLPGNGTKTSTPPESKSNISLNGLSKAMINSSKSGRTNVFGVGEFFNGNNKDLGGYKSGANSSEYNLSCDRSDKSHEVSNTAEKDVEEDGHVEEPIFIPDENRGSNPIEEADSIMSDDDSFMKSLPLTGDPEIDEEIIAFYRAKRSGGTY